MRDIIDKVKSLYETDEHLWMLEQIALLESKKYEDLDQKNLIEYLSEMAKREQRELQSSYRVLLLHMLKFKLQPHKATQSWISTIVREQDNINWYFEHIPSLKNYQKKLFDSAYPRAVREASAETKISIDRFPKECPWTADECLKYEPPSIKKHFMKPVRKNTYLK